jgi:uncharacterized damage-inducible protein DinB
MASTDEICEGWQDVRNGLIKEVEAIPADQFGFRAADGTRSVLEILQHIVEAERVLAGETCRDDTNLRRASFPALIAEYAGQAKDADTKDAILKLLRGSLDESLERVREFGDEKLEQSMTRFDGKQLPKRVMLNFIVAHEMYHRGQVTVYQRLLGIEPALTKVFKQLVAGRG